MKLIIYSFLFFLALIFIFLNIKHKLYYKETKYLLRKSNLDCDLEGAYYIIVNSKSKRLEDVIVLPKFNGSKVYVDSMYKLLYSMSYENNNINVIGRYSVFPHDIDYYGCTGTHRILIKQILKK